MNVFLIMIKNQVFYYLIIKDLKILISTYNKMKKQVTLNISEISSSDDEEAKPKIDKKELKKYIKDSDDESTQECQLELKDKKKKLTRHNSTKIFSNKTISQKISEKNLLPETELRKLRRKAKSLGGNNLNYSGRKNYKFG